MFCEKKKKDQMIVSLSNLQTDYLFYEEQNDKFSLFFKLLPVADLIIPNYDARA